jgi:hypothetical protein
VSFFLTAGCPAGIAGLSSGVITASAFRTYHTPLNSQPDFINAYNNLLLLLLLRLFASVAGLSSGIVITSAFRTYHTHYTCAKHLKHP